MTPQGVDEIMARAMHASRYPNIPWDKASPWLRSHYPAMAAAVRQAMEAAGYCIVPKHVIRPLAQAYADQVIDRAALGKGGGDGE